MPHTSLLEWLSSFSRAWLTMDGLWYQNDKWQQPLAIGGEPHTILTKGWYLQFRIFMYTNDGIYDNFVIWKQWIWNVFIAEPEVEPREWLTIDVISYKKDIWQECPLIIRSWAPYNPNHRPRLTTLYLSNWSLKAMTMKCFHSITKRMTDKLCYLM